MWGRFLLVAVLLTGCTAAEAEEVLVAPAPSSTASVTTSTTVTGDVPTTTTTVATTTTTALSTRALQPGESLAARADHPLPVFDAPGDPEPRTTLDATTILGTPTVVRVIEGPVDGWLRVSLPIRPNGSQGWIRESDVMLFKHDRRVEVDLGDRTLRVVSTDGVMLETEVAIGSPSSPTPVGEFFVTDSVIVSDPGGPWGPWAFGLSARSEAITEFNGGDGIVGIHGTNQPSSIGHARSLGCVRVPNEIALQLGDMISAGVPVTITD